MAIPWYVGLAILAGTSFAVMGIAYRIGQPRGVFPSHILLVVGIMGTAFFGLQTDAATWRQLPWRVVFLGVSSGLCQYVGVRLIKVALKHGPLSSIWCAVMLGFVPVAIYAWLMLGEPLQPRQVLAIATATATVVAASFCQKADEPRADTRSPRSQRSGKAIYGLVLAAALLVYGYSSITLKDLSGRQFVEGVTYNARFGNMYMFLMYAVIMACIALELATSGGPRAPLKLAAVLGLAAGAGSVGGMAVLKACTGETSLVFAVNGIASILAASIASVAIFRERLTVAWAATVVLGVTTIILST